MPTDLQGIKIEVTRDIQSLLSKSYLLLGQFIAILLAGARGEEKEPEKFRHSQNRIGRHGSTLANARFIPPAPDDMEKALPSPGNYLHEIDNENPLIKPALTHYQFETIQTFFDGNGRIGRMLIVLFLKISNRLMLY